MKTFTEYMNEATKMSLTKAYSYLVGEVETLLKNDYDEVSSNDFKSAVAWNQTSKTKLFTIRSVKNGKKEIMPILDKMKKTFSQNEDFREDYNSCFFFFNGYKVSMSVYSHSPEMVQIEMGVRKV